jgi:dolichol-phosphate mannosyltransferase
MVVVDDNSPDGTGELAETLSRDYPLKVVHRSGRAGLASAVVAGFEQAEKAVLGVMDADLQHPPEAIPLLLARIAEGADVVIASRYTPGGGTVGWSLGRRFISWGARRLSHLVLPPVKKVSDPLSGFFLLRRGVIEGVNLRPTGYKILLEILIRGKYSRVEEVPYLFENRKQGRSNLGLREYLRYLRHLYILARAKQETS